MITVIRRKKKIDAVHAIIDLVEKGFEIITPLQEVRTPVYSVGPKGRNLNEVVVWFCKLRAPEKEGTK